MVYPTVFTIECGVIKSRGPISRKQVSLWCLSSVKKSNVITHAYLMPS